MDKDRMKGKANEAVGTVKAKTGEHTGNERMQAEGENQEMKGKAQGMMGPAKDKARDIKDKVS